jgi:hypothetical protein
VEGSTELLGIEIETWVVLALGIATILFQRRTSRESSRTAERQARAAELQAQASGAALERETAARLLVTLGGSGPRYGILSVYNAGEHAAADVRVTALTQDGPPVGEAWQPVVLPHRDADFEVHFQEGQQDAFRRPSEPARRAAARHAAVGARRGQLVAKTLRKRVVYTSGFACCLHTANRHG